MLKISAYITNFIVKITANYIGKDSYGNKYYEHKQDITSFGLKKRFCLYGTTPEASKVPSIWRSWLHYNHSNSHIQMNEKLPWEKEHLPNLAGSKLEPKPKKQQSNLPHYNKWQPS